METSGPQVEDVISDLELQHISSSLECSNLEDIGTKKWLQHMSMVEELNVQAVLEASSGLQERVRDVLVDKGKLPLVVHELLLIEVWRQEILPRILQRGPPSTIFQLYMTLFHECNLVNLLETVLFSGPACHSLEAAAVDLTDYCVRQVTDLITSTDPDEGGVDHAKRELGDHLNNLRFQSAMKSLSILRFLSENLEEVELSVTCRMVLTFDVPVLLVSVLERKPWRRDGKVFEGSEWQASEGDAVPKLEAQVWLTLYNLLSKPTSSSKYQINAYRRSVLTKLLELLNDSLEENLPFLSSLKKWLLQLQLGSVPPAKPNLLMETVAEIREGLVKKYTSKFDDIAEAQSFIFLTNQSEEFDEEMAKLMQTFERESVQKLLDRGTTTTNSSKACSLCGKPEARNRCSRCHSDRYCSRECQVKAWPRHKAKCKKLCDELSVGVKQSSISTPKILEI